MKQTEVDQDSDSSAKGLFIKFDDIADFEIKREDYLFTVKVSDRRGKDQIDRIKVTVNNKQNQSDEDYLVIRNKGQRAEAL